MAFGRYVIFTLYFIYFLKWTVAAADGNADEQVQEIINFVNNGNQKITLPDSLTDFILVLGKTGMGKTPLTKWLTGDDALLESEAVEDGGYLMKDTNGKIGIMLTESATIYPDLYKKDNDSCVYYDFPGFHDTRGAMYDLAISYFIKMVVDHSKRVKILLVVDFDSLRKRGSRDAFLNCLEDVSGFLKEVKKFNQSMGIIVTKVNQNTYGNNLQPNDTEIIKYLRESMTTIKNEKGQSSATDLINILVNHIGIFRYPNKAGPYSELEILRPGKKHIEDMIYNKLTFANVQGSDFGYTISDKSKLVVVQLVEQMSSVTVAADVSKICDEIKSYYVNEIKKMATMQDYVTLNSTINKTIEMLTSAETKNDLWDIANTLANITASLHYTSTASVNLPNHMNYIHFLNTVNKIEKVTIPPHVLRNVTETKNGITKHFEEKTTNFTGVIENKLRHELETS